MPLSAAGMQARMLSKYGLTGDAEAAAFVASTWDYYGAEGVVSVRLQSLYTERDLLGYLIGTEGAAAFDWKEADVSESRSQTIKFRQDALAALNQDITAVTARLAGARGTKGGQITRKEVIRTDDVIESPPQPSDRGYRGDPLVRSGWPWPR